jgi:hypothetical protein
MMSLTRIIAVALFLLTALSCGCSAKARGNQDNMRMEGMFRFNIMQNDTQTDDDARLAKCDKAH